MALLTINDVARELQVKPSTLYAWAAQGKIPFVKLNGVVRFDRDVLAQWVQASTRTPVPTRPIRLRHGRSQDLDALVARVKQAVYTAHGETRPTASPLRKEEIHGAR